MSVIYLSENVKAVHLVEEFHQRPLNFSVGASAFGESVSKST